MPRPKKVKLPDTYFAYTDITNQSDVRNIQRQNYWTAQGHWVPVRFLTEKEIQWYELKNRGQSVGVITYIQSNDKKEIYTSLFILPEHRKKGYAKELYDLTIQKYKSSGVFAYVDDKNVAGIKLHESVGFKKVNEHLNKIVYKWIA